MAVRYSYGLNSFDTLPSLRDEEWDDLLARLATASLVVRPATEAHKVSSTPFVASFRLAAPGKKLENVLDHGALYGVDLDAEGWSEERLRALLTGLSVVCYTTTKATVEHPRWRVFFLCDRGYSIDEHSQVFQFLNELFEGELDAKCRNGNRIFYVPAAWQGAANVFFVLDGQPLSIDTIVTNFVAAPVIPPAPVVTVLSGKSGDHTIITERMRATYATAPKGGRFWKLLVSAAARFKYNGWQLDASDLANEAMQVSRSFEPNLARQTPEREALRAISYVAQQVPTKTPLERMTERLKYQWSRKQQRLSRL